MKAIKNILLIILIVYGLGMTVFANMKANEAEKTLLEAVRQEQIAIEKAAIASQAEAVARKAEAEARMAKNEAEKQRDLAEQALKDCK